MTQQAGSLTPAPSYQVAADPQPQSELSLIALLGVLVRRRRLVILGLVFVEAVAVFTALRRPTVYTTTVAFMPEGNRSSTGGVSVLAAQFGVNVGGGDGLNSPLFYPELIRSDQFLASVVDAQYRAPGSNREHTLVDVYGIEEGDPRVRRTQAVNRLSQAVTPTAAPRTGIVTVTVKASAPELSRDIAARILEEVTRFNQQTRQSRAAAEKRFVERRLADVRDSLRAAEDRLQAFLQQNRDVRTSPTIAFRHARMQREVEALQLLVSTLAPSYEQAKIEEVRDTPVITVIRRPEAPVYADPRGRVRLLLLGFFGGLALGVALALGAEAWDRLRNSPDPAARELVAFATRRTPSRAV